MHFENMCVCVVGEGEGRSHTCCFNTPLVYKVPYISAAAMPSVSSCTLLVHFIYNDMTT